MVTLPPDADAPTVGTAAAACTFHAEAAAAGSGGDRTAARGPCHRYTRTAGHGVGTSLGAAAAGSAAAASAVASAVRNGTPRPGGRISAAAAAGDAD